MLSRGNVRAGAGPFRAGLSDGVATLRSVKMLRRAMVALSLAGTIAGLLRLKGKGGVPPQEGGWREVSIPPR